MCGHVQGATADRAASSCPGAAWTCPQGVSVSLSPPSGAVSSHLLLALFFNSLPLAFRLLKGEGLSEVEPGEG